MRALEGFPRLYAAASLKLVLDDDPHESIQNGFPRLYAAASLKRPGTFVEQISFGPFSAAVCRGLIEAARPRPTASPRSAWFSAASLKHCRSDDSRLRRA